MCSKVDKVDQGEGAGVLGFSCALDDIQRVAQRNGSKVVVHVNGKTDVLKTTI